MKKVSFELELEVHDKLKDEALKECISNYMINEESFGVLVMRVIGEPGSPQHFDICLLYTSPSPRDATLSRMPSSA